MIREVEVEDVKPNPGSLCGCTKGGSLESCSCDKIHESPLLSLQLNKPYTRFWLSLASADKAEPLFSLAPADLFL